jgi:hypothetical protein
MLLQRLLLFCSILLTAIALPTGRENHEVAIDWDTFRSLIADMDDHSIHSILHSLPKYKHGAFENDSRAMEVVYSEDPALATSLVKLAKRKIISYRNITSPATPTTTIPTATTTTTTTATATSPTEWSTAKTAGISTGLGVVAIVIALCAWWFPRRHRRQ